MDMGFSNLNGSPNSLSVNLLSVHTTIDGEGSSCGKMNFQPSLKEGEDRP